LLEHSAKHNLFSSECHHSVTESHLHFGSIPRTPVVNLTLAAAIWMTIKTRCRPNGT